MDDVIVLDNATLTPTPVVGLGAALEAAALQAMVRGERPVADVKVARLVPVLEGTGNPQRLKVSSVDLAEGIMNLKSDPAALAEWANFILAAAERIEFADAQPEYWEHFLSCIWEIAFGASLGESAITLATAVRSRRAAM